MCDDESNTLQGSGDDLDAAVEINNKKRKRKKTKVRAAIFSYLFSKIMNIFSYCMAS